MRKTLVFILLLFFTISSTYGQSNFYNILADSALNLVQNKPKVRYDPSYFNIDYPNGDIPKNKGVCTDVIIRAYRKVGIDLQKEVHEAMMKNFDKYPDYWGLKKPDANIDHRRVPNLMIFFARNGAVLKITNNPDDYNPGDVVCWSLGGGITHIGIVSSIKSSDGKRYLIIHNIGNGQELADCLFDFKIIGHYRYGN